MWFQHVATFFNVVTSNHPSTIFNPTELELGGTPIQNWSNLQNHSISSIRSPCSDPSAKLLQRTSYRCTCQQVGSATPSVAAMQFDWQSPQIVLTSFVCTLHTFYLVLLSGLSLCAVTMMQLCSESAEISSLDTISRLITVQYTKWMESE